MSRIGKNPVTIPQGVTIDVKDNIITVKGKLGELTQEFSNVDIKVGDGSVVVGYRASNQGQKLDLALGFSHNIIIDVAPEVKLETISEKGKNPIIKLTSHDKQLVGQVAAKIRDFRRPEPYKGKGVKFVGEVLRRKAGKSA
jgi:large subunit ribosomal protein L6